jgi:hypothetical protein
MSAPPISPGEMQLLLSRAGLVLNPGQVADLVLAWRQVAGLIASIPHDRPLADDMAYAFHLAPPVGAATTSPAMAAAKRQQPIARPKAAARPKVAVRPNAKGRAKRKPAAPRAPAGLQAKAKAQATPKAAAKRKAAKPAGRKTARPRR